MNEPTKAEIAQGKKCRDCADEGCSVVGGTSLLYSPDTNADPACFVPKVTPAPKATAECRCNAPECLYLNGNGQCNAPCLGPTAPAPDDEEVVEKATEQIRRIFDEDVRPYLAPGRGFCFDQCIKAMARAVLAVLR